MKKTLTLALVLALSYTAYPQGAFSDSLKKHYLNLYENALNYNDLPLAISAVNNALVEMSGSQSLLYKDTLSILYFNNKSYLPSYMLAQEVYKADPTNYNALGRIGECLQTDADYKGAAEAFEKVAPAMKSPYYFYQLAVCQYSLKKSSECLMNADKALADTNSNKIAAVFTMPNGYAQQVPVSCAALNLKAVVMMDQKNYVKAKELLQQALKIYPDFQGAQQNLVNCDNAAKGKQSGKPKPKG